MGGGGKGGTTTQSVTIPPEVLARYNAVNTRAERVAEQPFQQYTGQFVAPVTGTQQAGISAINAAQGMAQPYFQTGAGMTLAGARGIAPGSLETQRYMSPYTEAVVDPTRRALEQQQGQERALLSSQAIRSGAFGGDRAGLERANLARQQALGMAQAISPLYQQGYGQALQTAAQQQGVQLAAEQANRQAQLAAGQQLAGLGTGAQAAALQGAQAQLGAGTLEQQTQQADLTARYQQFLQERGYPFQVAQFLANIAMGTGALSGSTTTTTQPTSFFSDERMKENIAPVGETFDGQTIYRYNYKGEPGTQIGLIAQEVERKHPEAVGMAGGMKTVDYDRATQDAGGLGKALASMGGSVYEPGAYARGGYAPGGLVDSNDLSALIASQREAFGPFSQGGPYGQSAQQAPFSGAGGVVPQNRLPSPKLVTAGAPPRQQEGGLKQAMSDISQGGKFAEKAGTLLDKFSPKEGAEEGVESFGKQLAGFGKSLSEMTSFAHGGGIRPHYAAGGGGINPYDQSKSSMDYFPEEVLEEGDPGKRELAKPGQLPSSGGGGLGSALSTASSLASLGSTAMKAAPMIAEGASALMAMIPFISDARLKHDIEPIGKTYDGQNIYRYHLGDGMTRMGLMAQEVAERRPDAVGRGPGGFLTLDYDKATGESVPYEGGIRPREGFQEGGPAEEGFDIIKRYWPNVERTESGGKQFDPKTGQPLTSSAGAIGVAQVMPKTAPEAARLAGVEFDEQRFRNDPDYNRALGQAYLREQYRTFGDPALALAAYNAGPGNVRAALARAEKEGGSYKQYLPTETQDYLVKTGAVPRDAIARAAGVRPSDDFLGGPPVRFGTKSIQKPKGEQFESWKDFLTSRQFLQPLAIGLGTMASSPSRYLGAAVLQGLGGGAQAYSNLEKQMADIAQTQQQTAESKAREVTGLSGVPLSALIGELGPDGKVTYRVRPDYFGGTVAGAGVKPPGTPGAPETGQPALPGGGLAGAQKTVIEAGKEAVESPIKVDTTATRYNFSVAPQAATDEQFRQFGFTGDPSRDAYVVPSTMGAQPNVAAQAAADQTAAQKIVDAEAPGVEQRRSDANLLVDSVFGITEKGVAGLGPKQRERASALALYDWAVKFAGLPGLSSDERQNISAAQIIEKVRQEMGSRTAESLGFHGQALAQALNEAQITGSLDPVAASKLAASLYVNTQRPQDFARYYNSYVRKYGTALNVRENFNREMAQRYDREKTALQHALMPTYVNGKPENAVMALRAGKVSPQEFDAYYKTPGLARLIMGG